MTQNNGRRNICKNSISSRTLCLCLYAPCSDKLGQEVKSVNAKGKNFSLFSELVIMVELLHE